MKVIIFFSLFILILQFSLFSQKNVRDIEFYPNKVDFHLIYSNSYFYNINGSPVNFQGISIGMYNGWSKIFSLCFAASYYFPKEYYGQLIYSSMFDTIYPKELVIENNVSGGGLSLDVNATFHSKNMSFVSKSEDFAIYPQIGISALAHQITYKNNPFSIDNLAYQIAWVQGITLGTINLGICSRIRIIGMPFFFKISQNFLFSKQNYHTKFYTKKVYSSYLNFGVGFTFPINKGPGVSKIKTINYQ